MGTTFRKGMGELKPAAVSPDAPTRPTPQTPHTYGPDDPPDEPLVTIEPGKSWGLPDLRELWRYRELLYFMTWRDIKVRYKQTAVGVAWVVLQPVLTTIIFTLFLGVLARVPSDRGVPYPIFIYTGLLPWTFFSNSVSSGGNSLVANAPLVTKVYFPRLLVPVAAVAARLVDFAVASAIYVAMAIFYGVPPTLNLAALPLLVLLMTLLALGFVMLASAVNVKYRDVAVALPVLTQLWMYVSPVLYPESLVPPRLRPVYDLNPLVGIVENFRAALLGGPFNRYALAASCAITVALFACAAHLFRRAERGFADLI